MKITIIIKAIPQLKKTMALLCETRKRPEVLETLSHTGHHFGDNMSLMFCKDSISNQPDLDPGIGYGGHGHISEG